MSWLLKLALCAGIILLSGCTIIINTGPPRCGCFADTPEKAQSALPRAAGGAANAQNGSVIIGKMPPTASGIGTHGCAVFGGSVPGVCQNYPAWTEGTWQPPVGVNRAHILLVGGGGGGGANQSQGVGGTGGGSGKIVTAFIALAAGNLMDVTVGQKGQGASQFMQPGMDGSPSAFGALTAQGGQGGSLSAGGSATGAGGNNGGGGAGSGSYKPGFRPGAGGNGGTGGADGQTGLAATYKNNPVQGTSGGVGLAFPVFDFNKVAVSAGRGGNGGVSSGSAGTGCGGGGGGGGGGVLLDQTGNLAASGSPILTTYPCADDRGKPGEGGAGYGAGGGGSGNGYDGPGGDGANGVVYVEW